MRAPRVPSITGTSGAVASITGASGAVASITGASGAIDTAAKRRLSGVPIH